ncbi:hypothetical protein [Oscillatoria sp. FACHB-1406]|uniref:hypothetical protein n=1 Tax=Oscillatoria sp. FACHB-1406 TaxID=2692846 RepID=UPI001686D673|nr:hypothetical protein [Oscillatoria sp. FACHB-1406]MBD2577737.1 hypothetical protein [Oscillatoria sp. FACHB-1406]
MPQYLVYGLNLKSKLAVPGLKARVPSKQPIPDVCLFWQQPPSFSPPGESDWQNWYVSPNCNADGEPNLKAWRRADGEYFWLRYSDRTEFAIDRLGRHVWALWQEPLTLEDTATYLLGPVLGFVLRLRGTTCLHASAAVVGERAIAFLGPPGAGKSTLAAAFAQRGYKVLTDDVAALDATETGFGLRPGYSYIRLWSDSAIALFGRADALPRLVPTHPTWDKRYLDLNHQRDSFQAASVPLARIYFLARRENSPQRPQIEKIAPQAAMMAAIANTYTPYLLDKPMRAAEFKVLSELIRAISPHQILPHADPTQLNRLVDRILQDIET